MKRPQFSLRLLLLVVTLVAAFLGLGPVILSAQRNQNEAARILHLAKLKGDLADVEMTVAKAEAKLASDDPITQQLNVQFIINTKKNVIPWFKSQIAIFSK